MAERPLPAGGFSPFEDLPEQTDAEAEVVHEEEQKIEDVMLAVFNSPPGRTVLAYLRARTEKVPGFWAEMGLWNGIAYGFAREGQNSIIRHIDELIAKAQQRRST